MANKLKICCTTWHVMHLYDLASALKDDADFFLLHNTHRSWLDPRFLATRSIPDNVKFVPYYEPGKYDLVILNCDQQLTNQDLGKYKVMKEFLDEVRKDKETPLVIINHGSPVYPEFLQANEMTRGQAQDSCVQLIKELIEDDTMVVNSYQAATNAEWGWGNPIWHGMNPDEWFDLEKEPRVFTALSPAGCDTYYNRECMNETSRILNEDYGYRLYWAKCNMNFDTPSQYREFLGRSLLYLDTSYRTPMNRARTEAMLSGCCVIQVEGAHDLAKFAKDGENIVLVPNDPKEIAKICVNFIEKDYKKAIKIGQAGKAMAQKTFSYKNYRENWLKLISKLCKTTK